jgi:hypothetical protein
MASLYNGDTKERRTFVLSRQNKMATLAVLIHILHWRVRETSLRNWDAV